MSKKESDKSKASFDRKQDIKKAAVLGAKSKRRLPLVVTVIAFSLAVILAGVLYFRSSGEAPSMVASADKVLYPVGTFEDGKARYYRMKTDDGQPIKFFILKSSDGVVRAAFDACDVCWKAGLGYYQDGDNMVCRNCGQRFPSVKVNEVKGGCNPVPLRREIVDGQVVIQVRDILEGRQYFDLSKRS
jgi:uncharacterized membrane protein